MRRGTRNIPCNTDRRTTSTDSRQGQARTRLRAARSWGRKSQRIASPAWLDETPSFLLEYVVLKADDNLAPTEVRTSNNRASESRTHFNSLTPVELINDADRRPACPVPHRATPPATGGQEQESSATQQLTWRGRRVAPDFQRYADRVAQGERLAPYRGTILEREAEAPVPSSHSGTPTLRLQDPSSRKQWFFTLALLVVCVGIALAPSRSALPPTEKPTVSSPAAVAEGTTQQETSPWKNKVKHLRKQFAFWLLSQISVLDPTGGKLQLEEHLPTSSTKPPSTPPQVPCPERSAAP